MKQATPNAYPDLNFENNLKQKGYSSIAGADEAGRGPLAGPVVAAAVILPEDNTLQLFDGIQDSKQLNANTRNQLYRQIIQHAHAYAIAQVSPQEIDVMNIHQASLLAMKRAVLNLPSPPDYILVDGRFKLDIEIPSVPIIKGDAKSLSIAAASILAKVVRDRIMTALDDQDQRYGWRHHKGYPTKFHKTAIQLFGPSPQHRKSYAGVKECLNAPNINQAFQDLANHLLKVSTLDQLTALKARLQASPFSPLEVEYLNKMLQYSLDCIKEKQRITTPSTADKGHNWESVACTYMQNKGYSIWERNYKVKGGELDLVCNRCNEIVFVEVKSRTNTQYGHPAESITPRKKKALIQTAERYLYERSLNQGWDIRYDLISILKQRGKPPEIEHIEDAFRVEEAL